jgi:hypothetical protein
VSGRKIRHQPPGTKTRQPDPFHNAASQNIWGIRLIPGAPPQGGFSLIWPKILVKIKHSDLPPPSRESGGEQVNNLSKYPGVNASSSICRQFMSLFTGTSQRPYLRWMDF